ncbi:hypothetical protein FCH28_00805 [Streptomyces piniterrae]|uniref:Uncharacterized protein n=1 Tax=Streptomyces piniterrae TaxID=2571125 RepID=A0A4U0NVJ8_9ACTN|nr:hypothetical protein [Streptomyces piniterrae]TJZ58747.1 hypothetical protein FCH28_00805 [Streptomyces piniterrae]
MNHSTSTSAGPAGHMAATALGILLWLATAVCLGRLVLQWAKPLGRLLLAAVAGMFGVDLSLDTGPRTGSLLLAIGAAAVA